MKKILILLFIIFLFTINSWGQINIYEHELIKTFPIGNGDGEIGFNNKAVEGAGRVAPLSFSIANDMFFFIADSVNMRVVVYNSSLLFDKNIISKYLNYDNQKMIIDEEHNIFVYSYYFGFEIVNKYGDLKWKLKNYQISKDEAKLNNYFYFDNYIFFYDNHKELKAADKSNKKYEKIELKSILKDLESKTINKSWKNNIKDQKAVAKVEEFINQENIHMIGNRILDVHYRQHKKFYDFMKKNIITIEEDDNKSIELPRAYDVLFINYDSDDNSYWYYEIEGEKDLIIIHNKFGQLIDAFYTEKYALYDVAPNGDVYVFVKDKEEVQKNNGYYLYKITRRW